MKQLRFHVSVVFGVLAIILGVNAPAVLAASSAPGTGQALEIAPPLITLSANPGQTVKAQVDLRDITNGDLVVTNQINDFVAEGEGGTPKILTGNDSNNPFSLKNWITPLPQFTLAANQVKQLPITIVVPKNASPGGHYGVVRFTGIPPSLKGSGVSLSASLGTLILLTVNGNLTHNLSLKDFSVNKNGKTSNIFQSTPLNFVVKLQNNGNVQEEPAGRIIVTDMFGKAVAGVNINDPPHNVLPDSTRMFIGKLGQTALGNKKLFGLYHANLTVTYGTGLNQKLTLTASTSFWVIPYKLIALVVVILLIAFFAIRFMLKRYKKKIIKQTTQKQNKQPTKRRRM